MFYGKVIGTMVATRKDEKLKGCKLLIVQRVNHAGEDEGSPIIAIDHVRAGKGDFVFLAKGKDAVFPMKDRETPAEAGIMGIIDYVVTDIKK